MVFFGKIKWCLKLYFYYHGLKKNVLRNKQHRGQNTKVIFSSLLGFCLGLYQEWVQVLLLILLSEITAGGLRENPQWWQGSNPGWMQGKCPTCSQTLWIFITMFHSWDFINPNTICKNVWDSNYIYRNISSLPDSKWRFWPDFIFVWKLGGGGGDCPVEGAPQ